jgi:ATP-dependent RNA circularization protein (DNA/RNA ligase family)
MAQLSSYSKVWALGHMQAQGLFDGPVVISEKLDGSQFSFGNLKGELHCRSKGTQIGYGGNQEGMFKKAVRTADLIFQTGTLPDGMVVRAECLDKPHHNTLSYNRVPVGNVAIWDITEREGSEMYLEPSKVQELAKMWGLEVCPTLFEGSTTASEVLKRYQEEWINRESFLGGPKIEGIVIKNYKRCDGFGKMLAAKIVSDDFKEQNTANWDAQKQGSIIDRIIQTFNKEAIWQKAIQHASEDGKLLGEAKDLGYLIGAVKKDFGVEHHDFIQKKLMKEFYADIERGVMRGFPEFYKRLLLEKALERDGGSKDG